MKKALLFLVPFILLLATFCKKDKVTEPSPEPTVQDNYISLTEFYEKNGVPLQTFTINAGAGGTYVSAEGTTVNIPANTFTPASANITIEFKDIYKKSDMLLSNMPTSTGDGSPLISAGQFYFRALSNGKAATTDTIKKIKVSQPLKKELDKSMSPYFYITIRDTTHGITLSYWGYPQQSKNSSLLLSATAYIHSLYLSPYTPTWYNTDHPFYTPTTNMTLTTTEPTNNLNAFVVFKSNNSVGKASYSGSGNFLCSRLPLGQECFVVAVCAKDSKLYSSFMPLTIGANQIINLDLVETTTEKFKAALQDLN